MQIHDPNLGGLSSPATGGADRTQNTGEKSRAAAAGAGTGTAPDAINLSNFAQQINDLQSASPDRETRIAELRAMVQGGEYHVDPVAVATKMVDDSLMGRTRA